jgi:hypothetical protein
MKKKNLSAAIACTIIIFCNRGFAQNVGIGTTAPVQKLQVEGSTYIKDSLGINVAFPSAKLDVKGTVLLRGINSNILPGSLKAGVELFTGRNSNGSLPTGLTRADLAFNYGATGGGYRHFISTRHSNFNNEGNAIDFWINNSALYSASTAPDTGNVRMMSITADGVKIDSNFTLEFGENIAGKENNAGKIGYRTFSADALDIVGAGSTGLTRKIKFFNEGGAEFLGNISIGTSDANAPLQLSNALRSRKIVLWDGFNNDHNFLGFGVNPGTLRYQVGGIGDSHVFFTGISDSASQELMRITGSGYVGIGTDQPQATLDVNGPVLIRGENRPMTVPFVSALEVNAGRTSANGKPLGVTKTDIALSYAGSDGGFRHFITTRHSPGINSSGNAIDFWINNSNTSTGSQEPGVGNIPAISVTANGVNIKGNSPSLTVHDLDDSTALYLIPPGAGYTGGFGGGNIDVPIFTNNTDRLTVKANGFVGIATSSPIQLLDVNGKMNVRDTAFLVAIDQEAWQVPLLVNGWINYGFGFAPSAYYKDKEGRIHLQGLISGGTTAAGTLLFVLPPGYRPVAGILMFTVNSAGSPGRIDVLPNGEVKLMQASTSSYLNLTGISFRID